MSQRKQDIVPSFLKNISSTTSRLMSRPRNLSWLGSSPSSVSQNYSSAGSRPYNSSGHTSSYSPSTYKHYNPYISSSSRSRPSSSHGIYGGTSSGYGGVYLPSSHSSLHSLNLMTPSSRNYTRTNNSAIKAIEKPYKELAGANKAPIAPARKSRIDQNVTQAENEANLCKQRSRSLTSLVRRDSSRSLTSIISEGYESGTDGDDGTVGSRVSGAGVDNDDTPDYKALWEASVAEVKVLQEELREAHSTIATLNQMASNPLTELEKRQRRAVERKLSEMEEELKQLQKLKAENERLKAENRALTRVVSKLTNSAAT